MSQIASPLLVPLSCKGEGTGVRNTQKRLPTLGSLGSLSCSFLLRARYPRLPCGEPKNENRVSRYGRSGVNGGIGGVRSQPGRATGRPGARDYGNSPAACDRTVGVMSLVTTFVIVLTVRAIAWLREIGVLL